MSEKTDIGIIGLGTMGQSLARCFAEKEMRVVVYNPPVKEEDSTLETFIANYDGDFVGTRDLSVFIELLDRPRIVHLMIKSGKPVDDYIELLIPLLDEDDIIVDGGNSHFIDTQKRQTYLRKKGIHYVGMGISGRKSKDSSGPSLMPGGPEEAKSWIIKLYSPIATKSKHTVIHWMGPQGTGHFAKMVHNGIQYAEMQLLAEACTFLRGLDLSYAQIASIFGEWNQSIIGSYLMQISSKILNRKEGELYFIDMLEDKVSQSGTGKWMVETAIDLGVSIPSIATAVDIRFQSLKKHKRKIISDLTKNNKSIKSTKKAKEIEEIKNAILSSRILIYSQAIDLLKAANDTYGWKMPIPQLLNSWKEGSVIRSNILENIETSVSSVETTEFLANSPVKRLLKESMPALTKTLMLSVQHGLAVPVMSASFQYYSLLSSKNLNLGLLQAQRDYFGAHGYERLDSTDGQLDYSDWNE